MAFEHFTFDYIVNFYTVFSINCPLKTIFNYVAAKVYVVTYWVDQSHTTTLENLKSHQEKINIILSSPLYGSGDLTPNNRNWPKKKLSLEREFLLIMTRLSLGLMQENLTWKFQVSDLNVSTVITTWKQISPKTFSCIVILHAM